MHKGIVILVIISVVLASLLAIQVIQDGNLAVTRLNTEPVAVQNIQPLPVTNIGENSFNTTGSAFNGTGLMMLNAESTVFNQVFKKVQNSVVQITSTINVVGPIINGNPLQGESTSLGSGFIQDAAKGLIITNNHVIQGSNTVDVTFASGNTYSAKVIGPDPLSDRSIADSR